MSRMVPVVSLATVVVGGWCAHQAQVQVVDGRREADARVELMVQPSAETTRAALLDLHVHAAPVMWVRSVLSFGERLGRWDDPRWGSWFARMIDTTVALDPHWRTPLFFGGVMLRVAGDTDNAIDVFGRGTESFPEDPYFPFAIGMTHYMHTGDFDAAGMWVGRAAELPGAPDWYQVASISLAQGGRAPEAAIRTLRSEAAQTSDPTVQKALLDRALRVEADEYSRRLTELRDRYVFEHGAPLTDVQQLVEAGYVRELPPDPYGEGWTLLPEGIFSVADVEVFDRSARRRERRMVKWHRR